MTREEFARRVSLCRQHVLASSQSLSNRCCAVFHFFLHMLFSSQCVSFFVFFKRNETCRIIRVVYEVVKEVGITESLAIGPAMRTLQVGEVLEAREECRERVSSREVKGKVNYRNYGRSKLQVCLPERKIAHAYTNDLFPRSLGNLGTLSAVEQYC